MLCMIQSLKLYKPNDFVTLDFSPEAHGRREVFILWSYILCIYILFYVYFLFVNNAITCVYDRGCRDSGDEKAMLRQCFLRLVFRIW